jgi:hypothetical protein
MSPVSLGKQKKYLEDDIQSLLEVILLRGVRANLGDDEPASFVIFFFLHELRRSLFATLSMGSPVISSGKGVPLSKFAKRPFNHVFASLQSGLKKIRINGQ